MERLEIKMIRSLTLIIVAAMFFLVGCATTPVEEKVDTTDIEKCPMKVTMKEWIADVYARNPLIPTQHSILRGDKVTVFIAAFNATPPTSSYDPDAIVLFIAPTDPRAVVGFVKGDCMVNAYAYPLGIVSSWIKGKPVFIPKKTPPSAEKKV